MHLCTVATLCFFKITSPRNYYYCDQDDFPWVCVSKYVSKSNCCHRHLVLYISDVKKFPYLPKIYISAIVLDKLVLGLEFFLFGTKNGKEKFVGWDAIYGGYGVATTLKIVHSL